MTERPPRSQNLRLPHVRAALMLAVVSLAAMTALAPGVLAQGTTVVTAIPGGGWIQSPDNTAGGTAQIIEGPAGPGLLGNGSLELITAANSDFAGVAHPFLPAGIPYADLTGGSWLTFVTGATGTPASEAASLRLSGFQAGFSVFTTLTVERVYNETTTPNTWQETVLADDTLVWQTTDSGDGFCLQPAPVHVRRFQGAIPHWAIHGCPGRRRQRGSRGDELHRRRVVTTIEDGTEVTDTFDFDVAAAPTPTPIAATPNPAPATSTPTPAGIPNTSTDGPSSPYSGATGIALGSVALLSAVTVGIVRRRRLSR